MVSAPIKKMKIMKLSLSKKNILRKNVDGSCILYDKSSNMKYSITNKLFIFLYLFKDNSINLNALLAYFEANNIPVDDIKEFLSRPDMNNLLIPSTEFQINAASSKNNRIRILASIIAHTKNKVKSLLHKKRKKIFDDSHNFQTSERAARDNSRKLPSDKSKKT